MNCAILKNESDSAHLSWARSCAKIDLSYQIIDLFDNNWLDKCLNSKFDFFLSCPPGQTQLYKTVYDERIRILSQELNFIIFPSLQEIALHENKRYLADWLKLHNVQHPATKIFLYKNDALDFIDKAELPLVSKTNIGASGSGVTIHRSKVSLKRYIRKAFSTGIQKKSGPNLRMGGLLQRFKNVMSNSSLTQRLSTYKAIAKDVQRNFVIFQEFVPHDFEWRIVRIGFSYFGHKKIKTGDKASGTKGIIYDLPPSSLLDFVESICTENNLFSVAIDIFEYPEGNYLVNEIQTIFGHVQAFICAKDGEPGRIIKREGEWTFEPGIFNENLTYDLRLAEFILRMDGSDACTVRL